MQGVCIYEGRWKNMWRMSFIDLHERKLHPTMTTIRDNIRWKHMSEHVTYESYEHYWRAHVHEWYCPTPPHPVHMLFLGAVQDSSAKNHERWWAPNTHVT